MYSDTFERWLDTYRINTASYFFTSFAFLPLLAKAKTEGGAVEPGNILNISVCHPIKRMREIDIYMEADEVANHYRPRCRARDIVHVRYYQDVPTRTVQLQRRKVSSLQTQEPALPYLNRPC